MKAGIWSNLDASKGLKKVHPKKWSVDVFGQIENGKVKTKKDRSNLKKETLNSWKGSAKRRNSGSLIQLASF